MNTPQPQSANDPTPLMTTINGRPSSVLAHLSSSAGVLVQCRLANGVDTFVPLDEIFALFAKDIATKIRMASKVN